MVETQFLSINLEIHTEFLKKPVNNMLLQIQQLSVVQLFKIVKIAILLDVGHNQLIINGLSHNMVLFQVLQK